LLFFFFFFLLFDYFQLRDRDREKLKECFSSINSTIETIGQQCAQFIISDVDLRKCLRDESKRSIIDVFKSFYNKFAQKDFTKHREKYIRFEPAKLETIIENFF
jgi:exocyst complex component 7